MIIEDIRDVLVADSGVTALVGQRVYAVMAPQQPTYPMVVISRISALSEESLTGSSGLARARYQFSCFSATSNKEARQAAEAIRLAVQNYSDATLQNFSHQGDHDIYEFESKVHHVPIDFMVTFAEAQPE